MSLWSLVQCDGENSHTYPCDLNRSVKTPTSTISHFRSKCLSDRPRFPPNPTQCAAQRKCQEVRCHRRRVCPSIYHRRTTGCGGQASLFVCTSRNLENDFLTALGVSKSQNQNHYHKVRLLSLGVSVSTPKGKKNVK